MATRTRLACALIAALLIPLTGMMGDGCMVTDDLKTLEGKWALERGDITLTITYTERDGDEVRREEQTTALEPLNPDDYPDFLQDFVANWNAGLDDLNDAIEKGLPESVLVMFPSAITMRIENTADPTNVGTGFINEDLEYVFVGDLSGTSEGEEAGGGVITAASIEGTFDLANLTTQGEVSQRIAAFGGAAGDVARSWVVRLSWGYTGEKTSE